MGDREKTDTRTYENLTKIKQWRWYASGKILDIAILSDGQLAKVLKHDHICDFGWLLLRQQERWAVRWSGGGEMVVIEKYIDWFHLNFKNPISMIMYMHTPTYMYRKCERAQPR